MVRSSCSTSGTHCVTHFKNLVISHDWEKNSIWLQQTEHIHGQLWNRSRHSLTFNQDITKTLNNKYMYHTFHCINPIFSLPKICLSIAVIIISTCMFVYWCTDFWLVWAYLLSTYFIVTITYITNGLDKRINKVFLVPVYWFRFIFFFLIQKSKYDLYQIYM